MEKKVRRVNISQVVASPVLTGTNDKYMWTGIVKSDKITRYLIPDDKKRAAFVKKVKDVEDSVLRYKSIFRGTNSILEVKRDESLQDIEDHIFNVCKEIKAVLNNPSSIDLDIDLFWFELCREYEEIKQKNPNEFTAMSKEARKNLEIFREYMNKAEPAIREIYVPEKKQYTCVQYLTRGQDSKINKTKQKNSDALLSVVEKIKGKKDLNISEISEIVTELCATITIADLQVIFPSKKLSDKLYVTVFKNYLIKKGYSREDIENMTPDDVCEEAMKTYNSGGSTEIHANLMADIVMSGINYLDIEKLMMVAAIRPLEAYELMAPKVQTTDPADAEIVKLLSEKEEEGSEHLKSFNVSETQIYDVIEQTSRYEFLINKILESGIINKKTKFKIHRGDKEVDVSLKRIEELMKKFCDGIFLSETMQLIMVFDAYNNENAMNEIWSDELVKRINLSNNDMYILSIVNFDNLKRMYSLGRMNKSHITNLVAQVYSGALNENIDTTFGETDNSKKELMKQNNKNLLINLYNSKIINEKDLAEYFELGIIDIENLEELEEGKTQEEVSIMNKKMDKEFNQGLLLRAYNRYITKYIEFTKFQAENPNETEKIEVLREEVNNLRVEKERTRQVFKKYNTITEDEKINFGDDLLAHYYVEMEVTDDDELQESIKVLYEDGFIDLENIIHLDKNYIIPMLDSLTLDDASKVKNSMTFEELEDMLDTIFDDPKFSDERKFIIVMNLLGGDTKEDKEAREFYLEMLDFNDGERKTKSKGTRKVKNHGTSSDSMKYVYPDVIKWKFYKALDKDVRVTRYSNGFVEFASSKLGARIIEKYYDGNKPAYGTATYILSEDEYRKNESDLITILPRGNILESATLREITPRKDRIAHRTHSMNKTWMDQMIKYFDIDFEIGKDTRYTREELKNLDTVRNTHKFDYEIID